MLVGRHGGNRKTVDKWKRRTPIADLPTGSKIAGSTVLSIGEEAAIVAFNRHTLLPLRIASMLSKRASHTRCARHCAAACTAIASRSFPKSQVTCPASASSRAIQSIIPPSTSPRSAPKTTVSTCW